MKHKSLKMLGHILLILLSSLYCQSIFSQSWVPVSGITGNDIGVGKNGVVWATGKNGSIYRWNGINWETMPGGATRIAVDPEGAAWVVNSGGQIYKYNLMARNWELKPGGARDIAIGANGAVWVIGMNAVGGGYDIYKWNGANWSNVPGGAVRIAVDPSGNAWVVNNTNNVFAYNGSYFIQKPGAVKDIGIGADGSIWCTASDGRVHKWEGTNWVLKTGGAENISVTPDGNPWVINGEGTVFRVGPAFTTRIRTLFPRNQAYEHRMLQALKIIPYTNMISLGGSGILYSNLDALGQGFGRLGLLAVEILFNNDPGISADQAIGMINSQTITRQQLSGILCILLMDALNRRGTDAPSVALRTWSTNLYRSIKIKTAKAILDEYTRWKNNPCAYEGLTETQCRGKYGISNLISAQRPPQDSITKKALGSVMGSYQNEIASGVSIGIGTVALAASAIAVATGLSTVTATAAGAGAGYAGIILVTTQTGLFGAFGGTSVVAGTAVIGGGTQVATSTVAAGAIGTTSWAGVIAAPIAATILAVVVGTIEGFAVVEAAKVEPMLKMKLGAAMTENIAIENVVNDDEAAEFFFIAFQNAAINGFQIPETRVDGEVRFYCQAGYVSSFRLSYTLNGQTQTLTTPDLGVGSEKSFTIPYNATNIRVQGWYALAGWKELFNQTLASPTYICYTSYGTVFEPRYKTDCPEVGNMTTSRNELTVTQGGGYNAWIRLTYTQNGQTVTALDQSQTSAGWRRVFTIPQDATNIRLQAWSATGLLWEPWKSIVDKSWPYPPNECIKVYNTTLDPKWNNECN